MHQESLFLQVSEVSCLFFNILFLLLEPEFLHRTLACLVDSTWVQILIARHNMRSSAETSEIWVIPVVILQIFIYSCAPNWEYLWERDWTWLFKSLTRMRGYHTKIAWVCYLKIALAASSQIRHMCTHHVLWKHACELLWFVLDRSTGKLLSFLKSFSRGLQAHSIECNYESWRFALRQQHPWVSSCTYVHVYARTHARAHGSTQRHVGSHQTVSSVLDTFFFPSFNVLEGHWIANWHFYHRLPMKCSICDRDSNTHAPLTVTSQFDLRAAAGWKQALPNTFCNHHT